MSEFDSAKKILAEMNAELADIRGKYQVKARETLNEAFKIFFETVPEITIIRWNQYTPYFNDGDACEFSVHEPNFFIDEEDMENCDDPYEYNPYKRPSQWVYDNAEKASYYKEAIIEYELLELKHGKEKLTRINDAIDDFTGIFMNVEDDIMLDLFNDHVQVTATKDGFEIDEYSHD